MGLFLSSGERKETSTLLGPLEFNRQARPLVREGAPWGDNCNRQQ
jgi:hypothetical protein